MADKPEFELNIVIGLMVGILYVLFPIASLISWLRYRPTRKQFILERQWDVFQRMEMGYFLLLTLQFIIIYFVVLAIMGGEKKDETQLLLFILTVLGLATTFWNLYWYSRYGSGMMATDDDFLVTEGGDEKLGVAKIG